MMNSVVGKKVVGRRIVARGCLLLALCGASTPADPAADDLYIVDCLLPGQVRQLGTRSTYVSARRAIKTSARDCAVRGGEYARHDRASRSSALATWLPAAREGDNEARLYVGTVYERGLGSPPDYTQAAHWYALAAEGGSVRAQLKLSELYEAGLGVTVDLERAVYWYQRATGESDARVVVTQPVEAPTLADTAYNDELLAEINELSDQIASMDQDNQALRVEIAAAGRFLEETHKASRTERKNLTGQLGRLAAELSAREQAVDDLQQNLSESQTALGDAVAKTTESIDRVEEERTKVERADAQAGQAAAQIAARDDTIRTLAATLTQQEATLVREKEAVQVLSVRVTELEAYAADQAATRDVQARAVVMTAIAPPSISLIDPRLPAMRGLVKVSVPVKSANTQQIVGRVSAPAGLLSLTINGVAVIPNEQGVFTTELKIIQPDFPVAVVAVDQAGQRSDLEFSFAARVASLISDDTLPITAHAPKYDGLAFGRFHALVIGNNAYQHLPQLKTAVTDAQAVADVLEKRYAFRVTRLINANRYQIMSALNDLRESLSSDDNLLVYYAGHGELDRVNMRGHWLPVDAESDNSANWISNVAVTDVLNAMSARQILLLADSCYSGALTRSTLTELRSGKTNAEQLHWIRTMLSRRSRLALTSGGLNPVLDAGGGQHSVFASALLDVLRNNQDLLEGRDLYEQVAARVAYSASNLRFEQVPEFAPIRHAGHEAGTFYLLPAGI